jgi:hypothetical protein
VFHFKLIFPFFEILFVSVSVPIVKPCEAVLPYNVFKINLMFGIMIFHERINFLTLFVDGDNLVDPLNRDCNHIDIVGRRGGVGHKLFEDINLDAVIIAFKGAQYGIT